MELPFASRKNPQADHVLGIARSISDKRAMTHMRTKILAHIQRIGALGLDLVSNAIISIRSFERSKI